jgi:hypothetical protein
MSSGMEINLGYATSLNLFLSQNIYIASFKTDDHVNIK